MLGECGFGIALWSLCGRFSLWPFRIYAALITVKDSSVKSEYEVVQTNHCGKIWTKPVRHCPAPYFQSIDRNVSKCTITKLSSIRIRDSISCLDYRILRQANQSQCRTRQEKPRSQFRLSTSATTSQFQFRRRCQLRLNIPTRGVHARRQRSVS